MSAGRLPQLRGSSRLMMIYAVVGIFLLLQGAWTTVFFAGASDADAGVRFAGGAMSAAVAVVGGWFIWQAWRRLREAQRESGDT
jgi:hypothetical protein